MNFPNSSDESLLLRFQRHVQDWNAEQLARLHADMVERRQQGDLIFGDSFSDEQATTFVANRLAYRRRAERERREELAQQIAKTHSVSMKVATAFVDRHPEVAAPKAPPPAPTPEQQTAAFAKQYGVSEKIAESYLKRRREPVQRAPEVEKPIDEKADKRQAAQELDAWYRSKNKESRS